MATHAYVDMPPRSPPLARLTTPDDPPLLPFDCRAAAACVDVIKEDGTVDEDKMRECEVSRRRHAVVVRVCGADRGCPTSLGHSPLTARNLITTRARTNTPHAAPLSY